MRDTPAPEDFAHANRRIRWSYFSMSLGLLIWNFPFVVWTLISPHSRVPLVSFLVFSLVSIFVITVTCRRETVVGYHRRFIPTLMRVVIMALLQVLILSMTCLIRPL